MGSGLRIKYSEQGIWKYKKFVVTLEVDTRNSLALGLERDILEPLVRACSMYHPILKSRSDEGAQVFKNISAHSSKGKNLAFLKGELKDLSEKDSSPMSFTYSIDTRFDTFSGDDVCYQAEVMLDNTILHRVGGLTLWDLTRVVPIDVHEFAVNLCSYNSTNFFARLAHLPSIQSILSLAFSRESGLHCEMRFGEGDNRAEFILLTEIFDILSSVTTHVDSLHSVFEEIETSMKSNAYL